jgi:uncharacterized membrane protein
VRYDEGMPQKPHPIKHHKEPLTSERLSEGLKSRMEFSRSLTDRIADSLTQSFGTLSFLLINGFFFAFWFFANFGWFGIPEFDPYPFNLLTMVVSLEAIFLATVVLISQNRAGKIADIRQKMDFEIDVVAEQEVTKIIQMLETIQKHSGIKLDGDPELREMERRVDLQAIRHEAEG